ncbi:MAG: ABC transporter permease [Lachnospiraceae bacterium]
MVKVENQDTLWLLTVRFLQTNHRRNRIAILAIVLTTVLFTALFTGTVSMVLSKLEADKKTYSSWSHVVLQEVTQEEARGVSAVLEKSDFVERYGVNIFVGTLQDERLLFQAEVRSADRNTASAFCNAPIQGRLPERRDEIALSSLVLDALGIEYAVDTKISDTKVSDTKISLTIALDNVNGREEQVTRDFYLCGWWQGDVSDYSQYAWVSEAFAWETVPEITREELENGAMSGAVGFSVWYKNLWNLRQKTDELGKSCGFLQTGARSGGFQINPAYEGILGEEGLALSGVSYVIVLIMLAGYLIIYNIFSISIRTDLRAYGLLKNVGTTRKQLARIVRMQAFCLCLAGIPSGLLIGYGCGALMSPALTADIGSIGHLRDTTVSASPLIFIAAAVFALVTVYLSCIEACRIVARVSPVKALCIAEGGQTDGKVKKRAGSVHESGKNVSWWGMALKNLGRSRKRGMIVMFSVALSLVTVNGIYMMVRGYSLDAYKRAYMASDFELDKLPGYAPYAVMNGITVEIQTQINACPDAEQVGYVRYSEEYHEMEPHLYQVWDQIAKDRLGGEWLKNWERMKAENQMKITLMGIDRAVFDKLEWSGEACTWEAFSCGDAVIVDKPLLAGEETSNYQAGDDFVMTYQSGITKTYQVLGEARLPISLDYPYANLVTVTVLIPDEEFVACTGSEAAMRALIDAVPGSEKKVQQYLEGTVLAKDSALLLRSVLDLEASFARYLDKYYFVGGALAAVLAVIGIMNFYSMAAASVLARRRELALLEIVGMTKRQICKMLMAEGCLYQCGAFFLAVLVTALFGGKLLTTALGQAFFLHIKVTVLPSVVLLPLLVAVAVIIPVSQYDRTRRESVVERIV